jgi:hypothetical protein
LNTLIDANFEALDQALELVRSLSDADYRDRIGGKSQPGAHIRHVLDHYHALREGCQAGVVDYDHRRREASVETDRAQALAEIQSVKTWLTSVSTSTITIPQALYVKSEVSLCSCTSVTLRTDFSRELLYVLNHTVHHVAYIALLLQHKGLVVDTSVGLAPATASHCRAAS